MSKKSDKSKGSTKKKVVVSQKKKVSPTTARGRGGAARGAKKAPLIFGKQNYIYMAAGLGLIFLGLLLMSGGGMDDPNEWNPDVIYSWRRTFLAPVVILIGLGMEVYAIFLNKESAPSSTNDVA